MISLLWVTTLIAGVKKMCPTDTYLAQWAGFLVVVHASVIASRWDGDSVKILATLVVISYLALNHFTKTLETPRDQHIL